jgi:GNAT superfamily N-acetyltransferase
MSPDSDVLPGQRTLLACWDALTLISPGARLVETEGAVAAVFPAWEPLNNAILSGRAGETGDGAAGELRSLYEEAGVMAWALWRPTRVRDVEAPDALSTLGGLTRDTTTLVMQAVLAPELPKDPAVAPASIAAVASLDQDARMTLEDLGQTDGVPGLAGWALLHEGIAVASAWSYVHEGDCGIFAVETLPHMRRRGFAGRLMRHVLAEARSQGATTASLQSTRMGQPLYESLGFTAAGRYEEWICQEVGAVRSPS